MFFLITDIYETMPTLGGGGAAVSPSLSESDRECAALWGCAAPGAPACFPLFPDVVALDLCFAGALLVGRGSGSGGTIAPNMLKGQNKHLHVIHYNT